MLAQQLLLSAFVVLGAVAADSTAVCSTATATIAAQADFAQYTDCASLKSLVITSGDAEIDISGPTIITGDLTATNNSVMNSLTSTSLASIGGTFTLDGLTQLSTLQFDVLTTVDSIDWSGLPVLGSLTFSTGVSTASNVLITNTFISSLDGINLMTVDSIDINNNNRLVEIDTQITNISTSLNIASNNKALVVSLPNLSWANNMTFRDVYSLSTPSLATVNGSFFLIDNTFTNYTSANLTSVGNFATSQGSLAFVGNTALTTVSFANVNSVGGAFQVANNTAVATISMPELTQVGGAIDLSGNFTTPYAPSLQNVVGALNIQSSETIDCSTYWDTLKDDDIVQGKSTCISATDDPTTADGTSTSTSTGSSSSSTAEGAASSYGINHAAAGISVVGGLLSMLL
ncbi:hypothetical protein BJ878DRAFT_87353 [Calycina marina]|uniref:Uncharacterized protein n=1 Tax=Calycina marina TaxID=1763456 RepID=A0A9P8CEG5_9HELO|nr:hypothetical protein BJ878DRAFT_87353 [Calycina marina]